jgi:hypothetical protein
LRPYLEKNPSQKRAGGVAQGVGPEFKPQYCKERQKPRERERERQKIRLFCILLWNPAWSDKNPVLPKVKRN